MHLELDPVSLRPIVAAVVAETLSQRPDGVLPTERLAFPEAEAAALIGVAKHILRDGRLRGESLQGYAAQELPDHEAVHQHDRPAG